MMTSVGSEKNSSAIQTSKAVQTVIPV